MQRYQNNVQTRQGNAVPGANVYVRIGSTLATIYSDNGVTVMPNPTTTDDNGEFFFYAANNTYQIEAESTKLPVPKLYPDVILFDPADFAATAGTFRFQQFTVTPSQTIINLTSISYSPGTNSVSVFMDGLRLEALDYTETSATVITLNSTRIATTSVVVVAGLPVSNPINAGQVFYTDFITTFDATDIPDGSVVIAKDRSALNDGGGGTFTYNATSTQTADNVLVFAPTGGGRVFREGWTALGFNGPINVKWAGAACNGTTDDYAAINRVISILTAQKGGTVQLGAAHRIDTTLTLQTPNIMFEGEGADINHNTGTNGAQAGTRLIWGGAAAATMMVFSSVDGTGNQKLSGGGVRNVFFDSGCTTNGTGASVGISIVSYDKGTFDNLFFREFQSYGITTSMLVNLFDARDVQRNTFNRCASRNFINQNGGLFYIEGDTAMFSGSGAGGTYVLANSSLNTFNDCDALFYNGVGYNIGNSDHNTFVGCRSIRITGGTGAGLVFRGSNQRNTNASPGTESSDAAFTARKNIFINWTGGGEIIARGTTSFTYPSFKNIFMMLDDSNATPYPTVETGALVYVLERTNGVGYYPNDIAAVFVNEGSLPNAESNAIQARARVTTESARFEGRSSNQLRIARQAADNLTIEAEWGLNVDATGDVNLTRVTGTGKINLPQTALVSNGIQFPATAVSSADPNTLDDYEEGTFTPVYSFATAGDLAVAYTTQSGRYVKIGNRVWYAINLVVSSATYTTAAGIFRITGLPFAVGASNIYTGQVTSISNLTWPASTTQLVAVPAIGGAARVELQSFGSGVGATTWTTTQMTSTAGARTINITGMYEV